MANSALGANGGTPDRTVGQFDLIIVGAGFAGLYMLHRARVCGLSVRLYEAGDGVGGTWYWNRYPGARVDLESMEYSYSFDEGLQQEWTWSERYAGQPELMRYLNHVADRFRLRENIQLSTRVASADFDEARQLWRLTTEPGEVVESKFCVMATGFLSAPNKVAFEGAEHFGGNQYLTGRWPHEPVDFTGQRVAVIGTGSSGVQAIPVIAKQAKHLTVFQRTPAFTIPMRNQPMDAEFERSIKAKYSELRRMQRESFAGFVLVNSTPSPSKNLMAMDVSEEERQQEYESRWQSGGLCFYTAYNDLLIDPRANETLAAFIRGKIRERVKDPKTAELLTPRTYPILTKRLCADTDYLETYNRPNVSLVNVREAPIEKITETGIVAGGSSYEFDSIVYATGFDAVTGALSRMDIRGRGGRLLRDYWSEGLRSYMGMACSGFPNLFFMDGPGSPGPLFHPVMLSEYQGEWILACIEHMAKHRLGTIEAEPAEEASWVAHSNEVAAGTLLPAAESWYYGCNIPGKPRVMLAYVGGLASYLQWCADAAANGYAKFRLAGESEHARASRSAAAMAH